MSATHKTPRERFKEFILVALEKNRLEWTQGETYSDDPTWNDGFWCGAESVIDWVHDLVVLEEGLAEIDTVRSRMDKVYEPRTYIAVTGRTTTDEKEDGRTGMAGA